MGAPPSVRTAWGEEARAPLSSCESLAALTDADARMAKLLADDDDENDDVGQLTAADHARLARLMADEDDTPAGEVDGLPDDPEALRSILAGMEVQLAELKLQKEMQEKELELAQLKASLVSERTALAESEREAAQMLAALELQAS